MKSPTQAEVRRAREKAGLTQTQFANLAGYGAGGQSRIAEIEAGVRRMDAWRWRYVLHRAGIERLEFGSGKEEK